ncbi:MAG: type pilus assembly protein PilM [Actinomycetia bacterium]|nr:type pilus assembly protein PilM [Actinomycetes bacterium]
MIGTNVIGLDVGTNAVRAVELSLGRGRPVVKRMGQVALPPGAVVAGEVVDPGTVAAALRRLWREVGFGSRSVVVGVANPRVVARMADLPAMPDDELRSSLPYQVQDLIPIPVEEAERDFQVVERDLGAGSAHLVRVLLVAAHKDMVRSLLSALEGANLSASRIDLIPFALIRALHDPASWDSADPSLGGHEVIIGSGAGLTNVIVHEDGVPRFVRTLTSGGGTVTEALALELGLDSEDAEAVKRGFGDTSYAPDQPHVDNTTRNSLLPLAHEVAGSLDFHLAQAGHGELRRVILSGGAGRLRALRTVLQDQLGVPVVDGDPYAGLDVSKVPLDPAIVAASGDLFAVAIGLALSGDASRGPVRRISLLPASVTAQRTERRQVTQASVGIGAFALALVLVSVLRGVQVDRTRSAAQRVEARVGTLTDEVASLSDVEKVQTDIVSGRQVVTTVLQGDVAWPDVLQGVTKVLPDDVWLTSFSGSRVDGTTQFSASGADQTSAARWLQRVATVPALSNVWLTSSATDGVGGSVVQFSSTAKLTPAASSDRLARYVGEGK